MEKSNEKAFRMILDEMKAQSKTPEDQQVAKILCNLFELVIQEVRVDVLQAVLALDLNGLDDPQYEVNRLKEELSK